MHISSNYWFHVYRYKCNIFVLMNGTVNSLNRNRKHFDKRVINGVNICIQSRCDVHKHKWNIRRKNVYVWNHLDLQKAFYLSRYIVYGIRKHTQSLCIQSSILFISHTSLMSKEASTTNHLWGLFLFVWFYIV